MTRIIIDVNDKNVASFIELANNLKYVKNVELEGDRTKEQILDGLREAVAELNEIKAGKKKGTPLKEFLDGL
jgi:hypothetical protein